MKMHFDPQTLKPAYGPGTSSIKVSNVCSYMISCASPLHSLPPNRACTAIVLLLIFTPPPQVALQEPQSLHWLQTQFIGHVLELHVAESRLEPVHFVPPQAASVRMVRVRTSEPPPHDTEQTPYSDQVLHTQLTGQHWVLQDPDDVPWPVQEEPPWAASTATPRLRVWTPPPHVAEHEP